MHYTYDIEKLKQPVFSARTMCVERSSSKSAKVNALRSLFLDVCPEPASDTPESLEASPGDQVSPEEVRRPC